VDALPQGCGDFAKDYIQSQDCNSYVITYFLCYICIQACHTWMMMLRAAGVIAIVAHALGIRLVPGKKKNHRLRDSVDQQQQTCIAFVARD